MDNSRFRVSLDVAKKMKELGYPQGGCDGYWHCINVSYEERLRKRYGLVSGKQKNLGVGDYYLSNSDHIFGAVSLAAAPCVGALGEDLINNPCYVNGEIRYNDTYYWVEDEAFEKEADARGLMWCELKERGLLD